ncbi:hypothetical protein CEXT_262841 [Caerostris extrusa]|uniref:Uncharacterized protein n=1 Tax=Caerostris extrusa TaxID=172846 RepID=A0AAV4Q5Z7_CAEEX|nr:hypothetical protein CEXT_262841 [Caerostris extrusa]
MINAKTSTYLLKYDAEKDINVIMAYEILSCDSRNCPASEFNDLSKHANPSCSAVGVADEVPVTRLSAALHLVSGRPCVKTCSLKKKSNGIEQVKRLRRRCRLDFL